MQSSIPSFGNLAYPDGYVSYFVMITACRKLVTYHYVSTTSTNDDAKRLVAQVRSEGSDVDLLLVSTDFQSAGRGCTGAWESRPGENLLFSIVVGSPLRFGVGNRSLPLRVSDGFSLLEVASLAVYDALSEILLSRGHSDRLSIKWPNDIFFGDRKLCGTLIENTLRADTIDYSVIGIGLNVRQASFPPNLPHASSLARIVSPLPSNDRILRSIVDRFKTRLFTLEHVDPAEVHRGYLDHLYRRSGFHLFSEPGGNPFSARIVSVSPQGQLILSDTSGRTLRYLFKQVEFVL